MIKFLKFDQVPLPVYKEVKGKDWIYYGERNDFPDYLLRLYNNSANHNAIVTGKVDYIAGSGWEVKTDDELERAKVYGMIDSVNKSAESLNEVTKKLTTDLTIFGGYYLQIIWTKGTGEIAEIYHIDYNDVRTNADNSMFYVSKEWIKNGSVNNRPTYETYSSFDPNNPNGTQILYFKEYRAGLNIYSLPDYRGAISYIELDISIGEYHLNTINNGMFSSKLINLNGGKVTQEEEDRIERQFANKFSGSKNAGKFMLAFNDSKDNEPSVIDLSGTELDKHFDILNKTTQQQLFSGHKVTSPMLFGIKTEGQLGGRNELREASELFQNTYVNAKQISIEEVINYLYSFNDVTAKLELKKTEPISFEFSEAILTANMTQDEIRAKLGLPQIEKKETAGSQDIINALNSLSPLIATKVVESMDVNELRTLIGLQPKTDIVTPSEVASTPVVPPTTMGVQCKNHLKEDELIALFNGKGRPKDNYFVLHSDKVMFAEDFDRENFADITAMQQRILDAIKNNPTATQTDIAEKANLDILVVDENLKALVNEGLITEQEKTKRGQVSVERKLTDIGKESIKKLTPITTYQVLYSYEERKGIPPAKSGSRPLCEKLYNSGLYFNREEIQNISRQLGYSVFLLCGGYYHNPSTGITTPYCRHYWKRNVVIEKKSK
jgi:hypothetical protein